MLIWKTLDVLIVDAKSDLNIYTSALETPKNASGGCCGVVKKPEPTPCCGPAPSKEERGPGIFSEGFKAEFTNVDLNEWAGELSLSGSRLFRDLRNFNWIDPS